MFWKVHASILTVFLLLFLFLYFRFDEVESKIYRCRWTNTIYIMDAGDFVTFKECLDNTSKRLNNKAPE